MKLPEFVGSLHMKVARLSTLFNDHLNPPRKDSWYSFLLQAELTPGRPKRLSQWKILIALPGIKPAKYNARLYYETYLSCRAAANSYENGH